MSSMFVSGWDDGDQGIEEKDMSDPKEQFLSAAENGNLTLLKEMYSKYPEFLIVKFNKKIYFFY